MKLLNTFLYKAPIWQVYISGSLFILGIYSFEGDSHSIEEGSIVGLFFGLLVYSIVSKIRRSHIFWDYAKEVEAKVRKAETKEEIQSILENEFQNLRRKREDVPHVIKLQEIYALIKTKSKYLN